MLGFSNFSMNSLASAVTTAFRATGTFTLGGFLGAYTHVFSGFFATVFLQIKRRIRRYTADQPATILSGLAADR